MIKTPASTIGKDGLSWNDQTNQYGKKLSFKHLVQVKYGTNNREGTAIVNSEEINTALSEGVEIKAIEQQMKQTKRYLSSITLLNPLRRKHQYSQDKNLGIVSTCEAFA